jgi:hypothetical protein
MVPPMFSEHRLLRKLRSAPETPQDIRDQIVELELRLSDNEAGVQQLLQVMAADEYRSNDYEHGRDLEVLDETANTLMLSIQELHSRLQKLSGILN